MAYKSRKERKRGGKAEETQPEHAESGHLYNAQGSPESREIDAKSDGFKKGGRAKRKEGGHVEGHASKMHLGRRARGGKAEEKEDEREGEMDDENKEEHERPERARGGHVIKRGAAPFSSAQNTSPPDNSKGTGPGEQAPVIP